MLTKLAFKNMSKSIRDYGVYFLTLVLGVSIFYMFNSIYAQKDVMVVTETVNESMAALRQILSIISVFVAVVLGCLIVYANNFFIKRRKKELGIYMTLGMDKSKISVILLLETSLMAVVALVTGLILGVFGSQFMSVFTASIFEADMSGFKFVFSHDAAIKSILYFALIFIVVAIFNLAVINKYKLIDLIYGGRKNEQMKVRSIGASLCLFMLSIVFLGVAYVLILENGIININPFFFTSLTCGTIGTVLFFFSVSGMLVKLIQARKNLYFKNLNMFVTRQLSSKINTNFVSISVVCIVLLLVIGIFSCGYSMQNAFSTELRENIKYDFTIYGGSSLNNEIYENLPSDIKKQKFEWYEYRTYSSDTFIRFSDFPLDYSSILSNIENSPLRFILLSDYNKTLELQGKELVEMSSDKYMMVAPSEMYNNIVQQFIKKNVSIPLEDKVLLPLSKVSEERISNDVEGGITFVVADEYKSYLENTSKLKTFTLNINGLDEEQSSYLKKCLMQSLRDKNHAFYYFISRQDMYQDSITTKAIVSFLAIYLGIVFMTCCAAILAIQQLSEAADNKTRYDLLHKLGTGKKMINKALFLQILCYFLLPLLLAVVHSGVGLTAANKVIRVFGHIDVARNIMVTSCFIIAVYSAYFVLTYVGSKNIINKG